MNLLELINAYHRAQAEGFEGIMGALRLMILKESKCEH